MSLQLDTLAYTNRLRGLPPEHKLLFGMAVLFISLSTHPLVQVVIIVWMSVWILVYARIPTDIYLRLLTISSFFWLTSLPALMINAVSLTDLSKVQSDLWQGFAFGYYYIYISRSGCQLGLTIFTRAMASVCCLYFLMLTVPFTEILQTLRRLGMPVLLTELMLLMYRFIFVLLRTADDFWIAQQSRGGYRTWRTGMKSLGILIGQLFKRTLEHYHQFSLGLAARGFAGEFRVWHPRRYRQSKRYALEALLGCVVLIALEWWQHGAMATRI
ncbi:MAG: cobalt ECF transporter T component CbiQ [Stigonema ocellatum SAG 48.90 = DSM 106950]|nr:cobalt ECF transporter T component CbiQ [Stigonema ocellatum SAG 48.90 = DSM 106950]